MPGFIEPHGHPIIGGTARRIYWDAGFHIHVHSNGNGGNASTIPKENLKDIQVWGTVVGGKIFPANDYPG